MIPALETFIVEHPVALAVVWFVVALPLAMLVGSAMRRGERRSVGTSIPLVPC